MKVVGFNFRKISVEKDSEVKPGVKVNTNIEIKEVNNQKSDIFGDKDVFNFEYEFTIKYEPKYAKIVFGGGILALIEDEKLEKEVKESWKKKILPDELKIPLMNIIFSRCNVKALQLEEDTNLPPHLPSPKFAKQSKSEDK
ncbi:hypothetical protein CMI46_00455 [Candidatus Pacearchaeota archaeon]|nr:hypothetical protein [Candidatus Pacearchaeota archaeon]|tara:strand:+ start:11478 stop:11900 length:423 start_codon:yes stop_codon:yes gene_type:complete